MKTNFGIDRVINPKGVVPVAAWKVDNSREIGPKEVRISLDLIHIEWDSFQQICNSCGFDEDRIKAKILDLIEKRGKLHNPFTESGGVLLGTVDEIGCDVVSTEGVKEGDKIYCITSLCGIPIHIDRIISIDYNYGQLICAGYAILFEATPIYKFDEALEKNYTMAAIDEAGNLYSIYNLAAKNQYKEVTIIGRNIFTTVIYASAVRKALGSNTRITVIMDRFSKDGLSQEDMEKTMGSMIDKTYFVELTEPLETYRRLKAKDKQMGQIDLVIVAEGILGAETLGVLTVKEMGDLYFVLLKNHYNLASLTAETMAKVINIMAFEQFIEEYPEFTMDLVRSNTSKLKEINKCYEGKNLSKKPTKSQLKIHKIEEEGMLDDFIYKSRVTQSMVWDALNIAKYDCNVIIQGETGVGKEKVLSLIHQNSERRANPCIKINCATVQETLAESEFFGYEAGAFTGAQSSGKPGYFEMANNGILFLDEIGTLPLSLQSKLLRVLQENKFFRVGGTKEISVNVRVICANNVPLKKLVDEGTFREDLFYRLNICKIDVPPLRERREDIICLAEAFLENWKKKYKIEKELSPEALNSLHGYYWPGNVRELENIVHRLVINSRDIVISGEEVSEMLNENAYDDMVISVKKDFRREEQLDYYQLMDQQEKQILEYALKKGGTIKKAAELLGVPQTTFARKKNKFKL